MGKFALAAALLAVVASGAGAAPLPTVLRGSAIPEEPAPPPPQTRIVNVCWVRINSIGNMPYRHCTAVELSVTPSRPSSRPR